MADRVAFGFDGPAARIKRGLVTGNPVRAEIEALLAANASDAAQAVTLSRELGEIAAVLKDAPAIAELQARLVKNEDDHAARDLLGVRLLIDGQTEAALDQFLHILKADRLWNEGQARKRLIAAFLVIDDADLVATGRRRMSSLLF